MLLRLSYYEKRNSFKAVKALTLETPSKKCIITIKTKIYSCFKISPSYKFLCKML